MTEEDPSYRRRSYIAVVGVVALAIAAGLGLYAGSEDTDPLIDINKPIVKTPSCDGLWQVGNTLPKGYLGCLNKAKLFKEAEPCPADTSIIVFNRHGTWYLAHEGETIIQSRC